MIERSICFGENNGLIGTICLPSTPQGTPDLGLVLFNAGVIHRVGPHRINVRLARILAERGIPSIRFDLAGQGDSARPSGRQSFEAQAIADVRCAMDALGLATPIRRFALFGLCSGAFHSYCTALVDDRIFGLLLFDAYRYPTLKARLIRYRMRIRQYGAMQAVGQWAIRESSAMVRRLLAVIRSEPKEIISSSVSAIGFTPKKAEFASGVEMILARGGRVGMIMTGDGFEIYNYSNQFRDAFKGLSIADRVSSKFFPDMDHVATGIAQQSELINYIEHWVADLAATDRKPHPAATMPGNKQSPGDRGESIAISGYESAADSPVRSLYLFARHKWIASYKVNRLRKRLHKSLWPANASRLIFVFGCQRSGTTMLANVLGLSPQVWTYGEGDPPFFVEAQVQNNPRLKSNDELSAFLRAERSRCTVLKPLSDSQHAACLLKQFPTSRALWIYRGLDDVVISHENYYRDRDGVSYARRIFDPVEHSWINEGISAETKDLLRRHAGKNINSATGYALTWLVRTALFLEVADSEQVLLVNYESLLARPQEELARIFAFVDVPYRREFAGIIRQRPSAKTASLPIDENVRADCERLWQRLQDITSVRRAA